MANMQFDGSTNYDEEEDNKSTEDLLQNAKEDKTVIKLDEQIDYIEGHPEEDPYII